MEFHFFHIKGCKKYQNVFDQLELYNVQYIREFCLSKLKMCPSIDWKYARYFIKFFKVFYNATLIISYSLYVTSNTLLRQLCLIYTQLQAWRESKDLFLKIMAENMKKEV